MYRHLRKQGHRQTFNVKVYLLTLATSRATLIRWGSPFVLFNLGAHEIALHYMEGLEDSGKEGVSVND